MIRILTAGESHGEALVGIVEGVPAGLSLDEQYISTQLGRRWMGFGRGGRARIEQDAVHIVSGVRFSKTIGSPIALRLENAAYLSDKSDWPEKMAVSGEGKEIEPVTLPRPGHADLAGYIKYGFSDIRPVIERASARETAMRVACCTVARKLLRELGIEIGSHVIGIGSVSWQEDEERERHVQRLVLNGAEALAAAADLSEVRMLDEATSASAIEHIKKTKKAGDSLGGSYEVIATGVPAGLGTYVHWDRRLDGQLAQAILSIPGQKAVEIGDGILASSLPGSEVHDPIVKRNGGYSRSGNRAGGLEGGVTNGMPLVVRGFMKPIPTLIRPLQSVDIATGEEGPTRYERSDVTSVPAASTVAEAMVALVLANALLDKFGGDHLGEIRSRYKPA